MEPDDEKANNAKKLNEDVVEFMRKRSDTQTSRYTPWLKNYVELQRKRERADAARRNFESRQKTTSASRKKIDEEQKDKTLENTEHTGGDKERVSRSSLRSSSVVTSEGSFRPLRISASSDFADEPYVAAKMQGFRKMRDADKCSPRARSFSQSRSGEPVDKCGCRSKRRRRRRRSCPRRRRSRRKRTCRSRRRRRRRRRRSSRRRRSRSRRRKSCARRRRRRRRRRRC